VVAGDIACQNFLLRVKNCIVNTCKRDKNENIVGLCSFVRDSQIQKANIVLEHRKNHSGIVRAIVLLNAHGSQFGAAMSFTLLVIRWDSSRDLSAENLVHEE